LLTQAHSAHAPWGITTAVSCLPVLVLGMGAALAHMIRADTSRKSTPDQAEPEETGQAGNRQDPDEPSAHQAGGKRPGQLADARTLAAQLTAAGQRVSRRTLRTAGLHGSNADLGALALLVRNHTTMTHEAGPAPHPPP
ncbi:MAG: hypothetical protein ACHP9Z_33195, partial [Streptosporangiales bacterium]